MTGLSCKVLIIGGGPGGYVAAIRSGQLGLDTVLVEKAALGGTCLNIGCIPSKALIHAAETFRGLVSKHLAAAMGILVEKPRLAFDRTQLWKDGIVERLTSGVAGLLKKHKVRVVRGHAECIDGKTWTVATDNGPQLIRAEHVVIATGSTATALATLPFGDHVISSTEALSLGEIPKSMVVVGAGYIGLELGTAYAKLGSKVSVIEVADRILPAYDRELTLPVAKKLAALGIDVRLSTRVLGIPPTGRGVEIERTDGAREILPADVVLVAVGRRPLTQGFGLEKLDLTMNGPYVWIDAACATSMRNVWAIGDVTGDPMLAHRAMAQGEMVAENIAGHKRTFDKVAIPAVCFTDPEVVVAGLSPDEASQATVETKIGIFPFLANARSLTKQDDSGFVRVVARADNHAIIGIQAVGHGASELSAAFGLALEMGARLEDIAATIHAHPTQGEGFQEAALKALGHAIHI